MEAPEVADSAFRIPDPNKNLLIIPCSASKIPGSFPADWHSILEFLPEALAQKLKADRAAVAAEARVDEKAIMPACRRDNGERYRAAGSRLEEIIRAGVKIVIVSGDYGPLLAEEPIGSYDMLSRSSQWPKRLLGQELEAQVQNCGLTAVRAFASASTDYGRLIRRVRWRDAGVRDGWLFVPGRSAGALLRSPRAQGEALAALVERRLGSDWTSSDFSSLKAILLTR